MAEQRETIEKSSTGDTGGNPRQQWMKIFDEELSRLPNVGEFVAQYGRALPSLIDGTTSEVCQTYTPAGGLRLQTHAGKAVASP